MNLGLQKFPIKKKKVNRDVELYNNSEDKLYTTLYRAAKELQKIKGRKSLNGSITL